VFKEEPYRFFRWWEWKAQGVRQQLEKDGIRDEKRVLGEMMAEHALDDRRCWKNFGKTPFDEGVLDDYLQWGKGKGVRQDRNITPGFRFKMYEPPVPGMAYACGMDCAEGSPLGDPIAAYLKDATGKYVASFYGKADLGLATKALVEVLWLYGTGEHEPLFAPEVDGGWGLYAVEVARLVGYRNIWRVPPKPGADMDKYAISPDRYGWRTQGNKDDMLQRGVAHFNNRDNIIWDEGFLRDASNFDPLTQKHTSDRLMAYSITESITDDNHKKNFGRQFTAMALKVQGLRPAPREEGRRRQWQGREAVSSGVSGVIGQY
jgi:hypothetical protein